MTANKIEQSKMSVKTRESFRQTPLELRPEGNIGACPRHKVTNVGKYMSMSRC